MMTNKIAPHTANRDRRATRASPFIRVIAEFSRKNSGADQGLMQDQISYFDYSDHRQHLPGSKSMNQRRTARNKAGESAWKHHALIRNPTASRCVIHRQRGWEHLVDTPSVRKFKNCSKP
jgi:hypothetical protein